VNIRRLAATLLITGGLVAAWVIPGASSTIVVPADADLQVALDRARPGDTLLLQPGATYTGNFVLPDRGGLRPITLRSGTSNSRLPDGATRIDPSHADLLPKLKSPNSQPALRTAPNARQWRILAIEFQGTGVAGDIIALGDGSSAQRDRNTIPRDLVLDRVLVRGDPERGQKRGISLNSGATIIRNSYVADIKSANQEAQAIAGWNGTGPYVIENNFLEASGVNLLIGGADPSIPDLVPTNITIRRNTISKKLEWRGSKWGVKNLLELKNARRVLIEGNRLENCWVAAQPGYAVLFTVRNSEGKAPWATIEDVTFRNNLLKNSSAAINVLGFDDTAQSQTANNILIQNNLFMNINHHELDGNGMFLQLGNGPRNVVVDHNTIIHTGTVVAAYGGTRTSPTPVPGFRFTNNLAAHNAFGIFGNSIGTGMPAIDAYFPDSTIRANVLAGGQASRYPPGNFFPSMAQFLADFVSAQDGDYHLSTRSAYRRAATDGFDIGANLEILNRALAGQDQ
jgi:hypothetical protein